LVGAVLVGAIVVALVAPASPALAFKPYTHNATGDAAWADATDDGLVTVAGRSYPVDPRVRAALVAHKSAYNAGVIGPDAYPDLVMGQGVIHPTDSGRWLRFLLERAWAAQSDPAYTDDEKGSILAWSYGFLTHAAGDMWAHTLINSFTGGTFPDVGPNLLTNPADLSNAVKHVLVEGYIADATAGYDGSVEFRKPVGADVSDDNTPATALTGPPNRFVYQTFVQRGNGAPTDERGKLLDFFYGLRGKLQADFDSRPGEPGDISVNGAIKAYESAWIGDIDAGLQDWGELGTAIAKGAFDAQTRRDQQNEDCAFRGEDSTDPDSLRGQCEDAIGLLGTVMDATEDFQNEHLISMLGFPDVTGTLRELIDTFADQIRDLLGPLAIPVLAPLNEIKQQINQMIEDQLEERFGIDIDQIKEFLKSPSTKLDLTSTTIDTPAGPVTVGLFQPGDRDRLDSLLGITGAPRLPSGRLDDTVAFNPDQFAAYKNTVTTAKLLLLPGPELNQALTDLSGRPINTYGDGPAENIMTTALPGARDINNANRPDEWLLSIDSDHAWRQDRPAGLTGPIGGNGNFPLWESCLLRPAFRTLFTDWENGAENFPDSGDATSPDPSDPAPPVASATLNGRNVTVDGTTYVGPGSTLTVHATDDYFRPEEILIDVSLTGPNGPVDVPATVHDADLIQVPDVDGQYVLSLTAHDACRRQGEPTQTPVTSDTTAPTITITEPAAAQYDTAQFAAIRYTVTDAGSGVDTSTATFDGAPATQGQTLDMYTLQPGLHTVTVTATDRVGNTATASKVFRVRATTASLISNIDRANTEGLLKNEGIHTSLRSELEAALTEHERGAHPVEWNILGGWISDLQAQSGKGIDATTAQRFIAYANDLIASGG
jgi:hypothetical protein